MCGRQRVEGRELGRARPIARDLELRQEHVVAIDRRQRPGCRRLETNRPRQPRRAPDLAATTRLPVSKNIADADADEQSGGGGGRQPAGAIREPGVGMCRVTWCGRETEDARRAADVLDAVGDLLLLGAQPLGGEDVVGLGVGLGRAACP